MIGKTTEKHVFSRHFKDSAQIYNLIEDKSEIIDIEESPQGEFNQEKIEARIEELVSDVSYSPENFLNDFGLDWKDFIDMDALIEDAIDTDGEAHFINHYDGSSDEMEVEGRTFIVMRID